MSDFNAVNAIGSIIVDPNIDKYVMSMVAEWQATKTTSPWWKVWKRVSFVSVTNFLLTSLADLIVYLDGTDASGVDKKATVLKAIEVLYDAIIVDAMPIYLKPFAALIRNIIINQVLSPTLDWLVDKYHNGSWGSNTSLLKS